NWQGGVIPVAGSVLIFPTGLTGSALQSNNDLAAGTSFTSLTIQGTGYAISGNSIALTGAITASHTSGTSTLSIPLDFGVTTAIVTVTNSQAVLSLGGAIAGTGGLTKLGSGELDLTAANAYTGPTAINGGLLHVDGSVSRNVAPNSGTVLGGIG